MNVALIFAGGSGTRMKSNGIPKQFLEVNGAPIIIHTLEHFEHHPEIDAICVVCIESWIPKLKRLLRRFEIDKVVGVVPGGQDGQESIRNGLYCLRDYCAKENDEETIVLIHDGVRPLIDQQVISDNIESVKKYGSAVTVVPAVETVVLVGEDGILRDVLVRSDCYIARAPQSFYLKDILAAHAKGLEDGVVATMADSSTLMSYCGHELHIVEGPVENIKVTTPTDFYTCRAYLQKKEDTQIWGI